MNISTIREAKFAQPFRPFRLHLVDGRNFLVRHPEFLGIDSTGRDLSYVNTDDNDRDIRINSMLIVSLEYEIPSKPAGTNGAKE